MSDQDRITCPKCGYTRKPDDFAPAWQCPQCGIVYEKYNRGNSSLADSYPDRPSSSEKKEPVKSRDSSTALTGWSFVVVAALIISTGLYAYLANDKGGLSVNGAANDGTDGTASSEVVLFSAERCRYCKQARDFLMKHDVAFIEYDINASEENSKKFQDLKGRGVPLIFIGENRIAGWNQKVLEMALKDAGLI